MIKLSYDLHIHSCLSPCGDNDMTPSNIVGMAVLNKLDVIAITDHNSCKNCKAAIDVAKNYDLTVICGMELTTVEEVHVLCLFPSLEKALEFDDFVYSNLNKINNNTSFFGDQFICDKDDNVISSEPIMLAQTTNISFFDIFDIIKKYNGIAVPAHIDKPTNSVLSNLGFINQELDINCIEISKNGNVNDLTKNHPYIVNYNKIFNSDAHYLQDISLAKHFIKSNSYNCDDILLAISGNNKK